MGITPKQQRLLEFIETFTAKHGHGPTQMQMAKHFGYSSLGTIQDYLKILQRDGLLKKGWNERRGVSLVKTQNAVPLLGMVAAGKPIEAIEGHQEEIFVPPSFLKYGGEYFALKVSGFSMIDEGILPGDIVIVRRQPHAENGQIVVALVNNEATIKTFYRRKNRIELVPANPTFKPILVEEDADFKVEGVFSGLIRSGNS